jgi:hypothetical protein
MHFSHKMHLNSQRSPGGHSSCFYMDNVELPFAHGSLSPMDHIGLTNKWLLVDGGAPDVAFLLHGLLQVAVVATRQPDIESCTFERTH